MNRNGIYEDNYEKCVMREYRMAAVRRSILNLCFLHVSSNIRGIQSASMLLACIIQHTRNTKRRWKTIYTTHR